MAEQLIGRYKIEGLLGRGAMGVVYKAYDPILDRYAAIKVMSTSGELDDELRARFFREARSAARLSNPNIIGIYDMGEDKERPFIAMEYVEGEDLKHIIKQRAFLPFEKKLRFMIQICDALHYAHLHGVVHRDIKPGNIRITRLGEVKILDFGLARLESSEMTRTGMLMGTPYYMSPEQAKGAREIDGRSDLFSVGVILYEFLSYHRPFEGETPATVCFQIIRDPHAPISTYLPGCDPELEAIIDKALAKNPSERFDNCGQMGAAVSEFLKTVPSRRAALLKKIDQVEAAIEAALKQAGITDRAGLDQMALSEVTIARPAGNETGVVDEPTVMTPAEREDYGSLLIRFSNASRQLDAVQDNLAKFRDFQEAYHATRRFFEQRDWQACLGNLQKIEGEFPVTPEMLSMRSVCLKELAKAEAERHKLSEVEAAMSAARAAWGRGNLQACDKACQLVLGLAPDCREALELKQQVTDRLERSKKLTELEAAAQQAWKQGDVEACAKAAEEGLALEPKNEDLGNLLSRAREALSRQQEIGRLFKEARGRLEGNEYTAVLATCEELRGLGADEGETNQLKEAAKLALEREKRLRALWDAVQKAQQDQDSQRLEQVAGEILQVEPQNAQALQLREEAKESISRQQHVRELLDQAVGLFRESRYREAGDLVEQALKLGPSAKEAIELRQSIEERIRREEKHKELLDAARAGWEAQDYAAAKKALQAAAELNDESAEARELAGRIAEIEEELNRAARLLSQKKYGDAVEAAGAALRLQPGQAQALQIQKEAEAALDLGVRIVRAREKAASLAANGRHQEAIAACEEGLQLSPEDDDLKQLLEKSRALLERESSIQELLVESEACLADGDWEGAIEAADMVLEFDRENVKAGQIKQRAAEQIERAESLAALRKRAREARDGEAWDEAQVVASQALALEPNDSELLEIRAEAVARIERNKKLASILAAAQQKFKSSEFEAAIALAEEAMTVEAGNPEAEAVRQAARKSIEDARQRAEAERQKAIESAKTAARSYLQNAQYAKCLEACDQGLAISGSDKVLQDLRAKAERAIRERAEKLQEALRLGRKALAAGRIAEAQEAVESARQVDPGAQAVAELGQAVGRAQAEMERRAKLDQLLAAAREAKRAGDAQKCSQLANEALGLDAGNGELQQLERWASTVLEAERVERERRETIAASWKAAQTAIQRRKYRAALRNLDVVLGLDANNGEAKAARQEALQAAALQRGKRVKLGYYAGAGVISIAVAVFGILPVVSTDQTDPDPSAAVQQTAMAEAPKPTPPVQPPPIQAAPAQAAPAQTAATNAKEESEARVSGLIERASKSLRDKDYATAVQLAGQALETSEGSAEARRIRTAAQKSLDDIAAGKRQIRSLIAEGKTDQALRRLNALLQLAPGDSETAEFATRLNNLSAALGAADKARTEMRQAKVRAQTNAADFPNLLEGAGRAETEAENLYQNRQFGEASAKFYQARDAYVRAGQQATERIGQQRLEAARKPVLEARQGFDQSRRKAIAAGADQLAGDVLRRADAQAGEARRKLDANDFNGAQQDYRSATRLMDDAADAAAKAQERTRIEKENRETALRLARGNAEQVRQRMESAKRSFGAQDSEAAAEEAKAVSLLQQGMFNEAAAGFERSLRRYQVLTQERESIQNVVSAFSKAYSGRNLRAVKTLWPGIDSETERVFKATFEASQAVDLSLQVTNISINQDSASATGSGTLRVTPKSGKSLQSESDSVRFQLTRNGSSWAIQSYRFSSK